MRPRQIFFIGGMILQLMLIPSLFAQEVTNIPSGRLHPPLSPPIRLSGNFGELRPNHFHSGIDIKTGGVKGEKIFAVADGYVYRIKVTTGGYGKAIYIHHPDHGLSSVYGHLKQFDERLASYVKTRQYARKSFEIQLFPRKNQFQVKKGSLIAYSGNSGSSNGPHLHFELRSMNNQHPVNPLDYQFPIKDNIPPKIFNLAVYPRNNNSYINGKSQKVILDVVSIKQDHYTISGDQKINVSGSIGFGIRAFDFLNHSSNWCGVNSIRLYIDSNLVYKHNIDEFSFQETRYINSLIDYEEKIRNNLSIQKSFLQPHNELSIYEIIKNDGYYRFNKQSTHQVKYEVKDAYGNTSVLTFKVYGTDSPVKRSIDDKPEYVKFMPCNTKNQFINEEIKLHVPAYAFYDTIYFDYSKCPMEGPSIYSDLHSIHNRYTPVHKNVTLSIKPKDLPGILREKAFIARSTEDGYVFEGAEQVNGFITTRVNLFGDYVVMVDNIKPTITPYATGPETISFKVTDENSGIKTYNGYIDGEWVLFEYEPKEDLIFWRIEESRLSPGQKHQLELFISDQLNNIATYHDTITINQGLLKNTKIP